MGGGEKEGGRKEGTEGGREKGGRREGGRREEWGENKREKYALEQLRSLPSLPQASPAGTA